MSDNQSGFCFLMLAVGIVLFLLLPASKHLVSGWFIGFVSGFAVRGIWDRRAETQGKTK